MNNRGISDSWVGKTVAGIVAGLVLSGAGAFMGSYLQGKVQVWQITALAKDVEAGQHRQSELEKQIGDIREKIASELGEIKGELRAIRRTMDRRAVDMRE